ncbi:hypothetical protein V2J09_005818 [Rumex salicifolius]
MEELNAAMLGKLRWRFLKENGKLWVDIMRTKYVRDNPRTTVPSTHIWKGLRRGVKDIIVKGSRWISENKRSIQFWANIWLMEERLANWALDNVEGLLGKTVQEYRNSEIGWRRDLIDNLLPLQIILKLAATLSKDDVRSGYSLARGDSDSPSIDHDLFKAIGKLETLERCRTFTWLVARGGVLRNMERTQRHIANSSLFPICLKDEESYEHLFKDCPVTRDTWKLWNTCSNLASV